MLRDGRSVLPVPGPLFRLDNGPSSLYESYGSCIRHSSSSWFPSPSLPRRLVGSGILSRGSHQGEGLPVGSMYSPRHLYQPPEVSPLSNSIADLFRDENSIGSFEGFPDCGAPRGFLSPAPRVHVISSPPCSSVAQSPGQDVVSVSLGSGFSAPYEVAPTLPQEILRFSEGGLGHRLGRIMPRGSSVVVHRLQPHLRDTTHFSPSGCPAVHRRLLSGLGRRSGGGTRFGPVVFHITSPLQQSLGAPSCRAIPLRLSGSSPSPAGGSLCGQHNSHRLPQEVRGGTKSPTLNVIFQSILRVCESWDVLLLPQFIEGSLNVMADALSCRNQVLGSEWTLCAEVFRELQRRWSVSVDLFSTNLNHQLPVYFSPVLDPMSAGTDAMLQSWNDLEVYAFPPFALVHPVLLKLR